MNNKRFALLILILTLLFPLAATGENPDLSLTVPFRLSYSEEYSQWDFPYNDSWFTMPADSYSHDLARASLGLSLAASRDWIDSQDTSARAFLTDAGFTDLRGDGYNEPTDRNTIATMIGRKTLPGGQTLLAVGISGRNYQNEWLGNLDLGDQTDHLGFSTAAQKVVSRVCGYIADHGISGDVKIWLSGFSRAGAVSNLTGAMLMQQGVVSGQNAYVYTFASPNTTKAPISCSNIFNIVGKFDPATKLPFGEWGYGRHGKTFYTLAQETDSDYRQKHKAASAVYEQITGGALWNDPEVNHHFAIIAEYLTSIIPNSKVYHEQLSEHMDQIWQNPDLKSINALIDALVHVETVDDLYDLDQQKRIKDLTEYLYGISYSLVADQFTGKEPDDVYDVTAFGKLLHEHDPIIYLAWLFSSDDPQDVFSENMTYTRVYFDGNAEISLFDQRGGFIYSMSVDGQISEDTQVERYHKRIRDKEDRPLIYSHHSGEQNVLVLPKDQGFPFVLKAHDEGYLAYFGILYNILEASPTSSSIRILAPETDRHYIGFSFTPDGMERMHADEHVWGDCAQIATVAADAQLLSAAITIPLDGVTDITIDLRTLVIIILAVLAVILILALILLFILLRLIWRLIRRIKRKYRRGA